MAEPDERAQPAARTRAPLWMRILLFVSLAVNLLVLGTAGGLLVRGRAWQDEPPDARLVFDLGLGPYVRALSPEDRDGLRAAAASRRADFRGNRADMRRTFEETLAALRADPFQPERLSAVIARQGEIADRGRQIGQDLFIAHVAAMTPDARHALADRLETSVRRHRPHDHDDRR